MDEINPAVSILEVVVALAMVAISVLVVVPPGSCIAIPVVVLSGIALATVVIFSGLLGRTPHLSTERVAVAEGMVSISVDWADGIHDAIKLVLQELGLWVLFFSQGDDIVALHSVIAVPAAVIPSMVGL